jgi:hypothetical protein
VVLLAVTQGSVLAAAPSWFAFYADYLAPATALCVAAALVSRPAGRRKLLSRLGRAAPGILLTLALLLTTSFLTGGENRSAIAFPGTRLADAVRDTRCVMSDSPMGLILLNALSRDLANGCRNWVDVTGRTYGIDAAVAPDGRHLPRRDNAKWHHDLLAFERSGSAAIVVRRSGSGITPGMLAALRRGGVLARAGSETVYRTPHPARSGASISKQRGPATIATRPPAGAGRRD